MSEIKLFNHPDFGGVRTVEENGRILFCGRDVATALGYENPGKAIRDHARQDGGPKRYPISDSLGRTQQATFITEGDLYRLIASSKLPSAAKFETWVFDEVLPSIRKHGGYLTAAKVEEALLNPDILIRLASSLKLEREARAKAEAQIEADKPKVLFADAVSSSPNSILIGELAKILRGNGIDIGQNRLFSWLRENGYLHKSGEQRNLPTQKAMDIDLFRTKKSSIVTSDGANRITTTTKVTGRGQQYFIQKFLQGKQLVKA